MTVDLNLNAANPNSDLRAVYFGISVKYTWIITCL